jgi:hypothetical protein
MCLPVLLPMDPCLGVRVCVGLRFATHAPTRDNPTRDPYGFVTPVTIPTDSEVQAEVALFDTANGHQNESIEVRKKQLSGRRRVK